MICGSCDVRTLHNVVNEIAKMKFIRGRKSLKRFKINYNNITFDRFTIILFRLLFVSQYKKRDSVSIVDDPHKKIVNSINAI